MNNKAFQMSLVSMWVLLGVFSIASGAWLAGRVAEVFGKIDALSQSITLQNGEIAAISSKIAFFEENGETIEKELSGYEGTGLDFNRDSPINICDGFHMTPYSWGVSGVRAFSGEFKAEYFRFSEYCSKLRSACPVSAPLYV